VILALTHWINYWPRPQKHWKSTFCLFLSRDQ